MDNTIGSIIADLRTNPIFLGIADVPMERVGFPVARGAALAAGDPTTFRDSCDEEILRLLFDGQSAEGTDRYRGRLRRAFDLPPTFTHGVIGRASQRAAIAAQEAAASEVAPPTMSFPLFGHLPSEIRQQIWQHAVDRVPARSISAFVVGQNRTQRREENGQGDYDGLAQYAPAIILSFNRDMFRAERAMMWTCSESRAVLVRNYPLLRTCHFPFRPDVDSIRVRLGPKFMPQFAKLQDFGAFRRSTMQWTDSERKAVYISEEYVKSGRFDPTMQRRNQRKLLGNVILRVISRVTYDSDGSDEEYPYKDATTTFARLPPRIDTEANQDQPGYTWLRELLPDADDKAEGAGDIFVHVPRLLPHVQSLQLRFPFQGSMHHRRDGHSTSGEPEMTENSWSAMVFEAVLKALPIAPDRFEVQLHHHGIGNLVNLLRMRLGGHLLRDDHHGRILFPEVAPVRYDPNQLRTLAVWYGFMRRLFQYMTTTIAAEEEPSSEQFGGRKVIFQAVRCDCEDYWRWRKGWRREHDRHHQQ